MALVLLTKNTFATEYFFCKKTGHSTGRHCISDSIFPVKTKKEMQTSCCYGLKIALEHYGILGHVKGINISFIFYEVL